MGVCRPALPIRLLSGSISLDVFLIFLFLVCREKNLNARKKSGKNLNARKKSGKKLKCDKKSREKNLQARKKSREEKSSTKFAWHLLGSVKKQLKRPRDHRFCWNSWKEGKSFMSLARISFEHKTRGSYKGDRTNDRVDVLSFGKRKEKKLRFGVFFPSVVSMITGNTFNHQAILFCLPTVIIISE